MRTLAIDLGVSRCAIAVFADASPLAQQVTAIPNGVHSAILPSMIASVLEQGDTDVRGLGLLTVMPNPGISFTGMRSALAFVQGLGLSIGCPAIRISMLEALSVSAGPIDSGREIWCVTAAENGLVAIEHSGGLSRCPISLLPRPAGPIAVLGDAAPDVAARLRAEGHDVLLIGPRAATLPDIAAAGLKRLKRAEPVGSVQPLHEVYRPIQLRTRDVRPAPI